MPGGLTEVSGIQVVNFDVGPIFGLPHGSYFDRYQATVMADGPFIYLPLNDAVGKSNAVDLAAGSIAQIQGSVTLQYEQVRPSTPNFGVRFGNATAARIRMLTEGGYDGTNAQSWECWLKNQAASSGYLSIMGANDPGGSNVCMMAADAGAAVNDLINVNVRNSANLNTSQAAFNSGAPMHYVCTITSGNGPTLKQYINGVLKTTDTLATSRANASDLWGPFLGASVNTFWKSVAISASDFALYNKVLTDAQVFSHFQAGWG